MQPTDIPTKGLLWQHFGCDFTKEVFGDITDFHLFQDGIQGWHLLVLGNAGVIQELLKLRAFSSQVVHLQCTSSLTSAGHDDST